MEYIYNTASFEIIDALFGNADNKKIFIIEHMKKTKKELSKFKKDDLNNIIQQNWDYNKVKYFIWSKYKNSDKYKRGLNSKKELINLLNDLKELNFQNIGWPCNQSDWENHTQKLITQSKLGNFELLETISKNAKNFLIMKKFNSLRHDYIEHQILTKHDDTIPTLSNTKGVDIVINGLPLDLKISSSVTKEFQKKYAGNWKEQAKANPQEVAKYLYSLQSEERFSYTPRLFIIHIEEFNLLEYNLEELEAKINLLDNLIPIQFEYNLKSNKINKLFNTYCYVIFI